MLMLLLSIIVDVLLSICLFARMAARCFDGYSTAMNKIRLRTHQVKQFTSDKQTHGQFIFGFWYRSEQ
jgi:hypothetical protein